MADEELGLRSLELYYIPIKNREYDSIVDYRAQLRINDPQLGVLLPEEYLPVAQRSLQAYKLTMSAIETVMEDIKKFRNRDAFFEWISVYVPERVLSEKNFVANLEELATNKQFNLSDLCIELSQDVFYGDVAVIVDELRNMNIKVLIVDFGGPFCPITRLCSLKCDYVLMDEIYTEWIQSESNSEKEMSISVFEMIRAQNVQAIVAGIKTAEQLKLFPESCVLFTGKFIGRPRKASGIR